MERVPHLATLPSAGSDQFLAAMRRVFSLVAIVTTDGPAGRFGITVNSATSASADPPMTLVCINHNSPVNQAIRANHGFCLNILSFGQEDLSDTFAGRPRDGAPFSFDDARWTVGETHSPQLEGAVASFDCVLHSATQLATHTLFVGRVVGVVGDETVPLIYGSRTYGRPDTGV